MSPAPYRRATAPRSCSAMRAVCQPGQDTRRARVTAAARWGLGQCARTRTAAREPPRRGEGRPRGVRPGLRLARARRVVHRRDAMRRQLPRRGASGSDLEGQRRRPAMGGDQRHGDGDPALRLGRDGPDEARPRPRGAGRRLPPCAGLGSARTAARRRRLVVLGAAGTRHGAGHGARHAHAAGRRGDGTRHRRPAGRGVGRRRALPRLGSSNGWSGTPSRWRRDSSWRASAWARSSRSGSGRG